MDLPGFAKSLWNFGFAQTCITCLFLEIKFRITRVFPAVDSKNLNLCTIMLKSSHKQDRCKSLKRTLLSLPSTPYLGMARE